jgi:phosphohistidine phosphatase
MDLYILRHGIAEDTPPGRTDADRRLTEEGRAKLRNVLKRARGAVGTPGLILSSPLVRAVETAQIAAEVFGYGEPIEQTDALLPSSSPQAVWRAIRSRAGDGAILLAGHEPLLSETASYLLGASRVELDFKKGALMRIYVGETTGAPRGILKWLLTPKLAGD